MINGEPYLLKQTSLFPQGFRGVYLSQIDAVGNDVSTLFPVSLLSGEEVMAHAPILDASI